MSGSAPLDWPNEQQNRRLGKRLGSEIYVASEASATPLTRYALLSNLSPREGVSMPLDSGNADAIQPQLSRCPQAYAEAICPTCGGSPAIALSIRRKSL